MADSLEGRPREELLARLEDEDWRVREDAAKALRGSAGDAHVRRALLALLDGQHPMEEHSVVEVLGPWADEDEQIRECLLTRLSEEGSPPGAAVAFAADAPYGVRHAVAELLGLLAREDGGVRETLRSRLDDALPFVRRSAARALGVRGRDAEPEPVPWNDCPWGEERQRLLTLLAKPGVDVRWRSFAELGGSLEPAWILEVSAGVNRVDLELVAALSSRWVRSWALAQALGPVLARMPGVREFLLGRLRPGGSGTGWRGYEQRLTVARLLLAMAERDAEVCHALLLQLGPRCAGVREGPPLDLDTQEEIAERLGIWASHDDVLRRTLRERFGLLPLQLQVSMVEGLARGGGQAPDIVEWVLPWLDAEDEPGRDRYFAWEGAAHHSFRALYLGRRAAHDERLRARLVERLRHPEWRMRLGAVTALVFMPGRAPGLAPLLAASLLEDRRDAGQWDERLQASRWLIQVRDRAARERALDCALSALEYGNASGCPKSNVSRWHARAAEVLGGFESPHRREEVLSRLQRLARESSHEEAREAARHAVRRLGSAPVT